MKETEIAKGNVGNVKRVEKQGLEISKLHYLGIASFHRETCQRWLSFLERFPKHILLSMLDGNKTERILNNLKDNKITDLKNAISLYEENGI